MSIDTAHARQICLDTHDGFVTASFALSLLGEIERLRAALGRALELAHDLRSYTHDWDWEYGKEWDAELAALAPPPAPLTVEEPTRAEQIRWGHEPTCRCSDCLRARGEWPPTAPPALTTEPAGKAGA